MTYTANTQPLKARPYEAWATSALLKHINSGRIDRMPAIVGQHIDAELQWRRFEQAHRQPGQKFAYER